MGTNNRREVAKRLTQQIAVTKDTQALIELTKQLAKVLPKRRKSAEVKKSNYNPRAPRTGSLVDSLSEDERLINNMVIRAEEIIREAKRQGLPVPTNKEAADQARSEI